MGKVMSAKEAVMLVKGGDTIAVGGFVGCNHPEEFWCSGKSGMYSGSAISV